MSRHMRNYPGTDSLHPDAPWNKKEDTTMSYVRCMYCEESGDCKDEWIEGVHNPDPPFDFICPWCVDNIVSGNCYLPDDLDDDHARDLFAVANGKPTRVEYDRSRREAMEEDAGEARNEQSRWFNARRT